MEGKDRSGIMCMGDIALGGCGVSMFFKPLNAHWTGFVMMPAITWLLQWKTKSMYEFASLQNYEK